MDDTILELKQISKGFGSTDVLRGIDLTVRAGEFITLLGPSGCGKTTTLRIIAGLEAPDTGKVYLNGVDVTDYEPNLRDVNTVFQSYALFPHMDVAGNIGYGLKLKKVPKAEIRRAVTDALALVRLPGYEKRYPSELSGGQRQRVAIARAIVNRPKVLLLDEPLGALDLQLRRQMQIELKRLQKKLGITFIYITHDQEEAINMSDRIAVMKDGRFEQIGTPSEVYDTPKTSYVASFVGSANVLSGTAAGMRDGNVLIRCREGIIMADAKGRSFAPLTPLTFAVRSENITLASPDAEFGIPARILEKSFAGGMLRISMIPGTAPLAAADTKETHSHASGRDSDSDPAGTDLAAEDVSRPVNEIIASRHGIDSAAEPGELVMACFDPKDAVLVDLPDEEGREV